MCYQGTHFKLHPHCGHNVYFNLYIIPHITVKYVVVKRH
jgi:hypothetical protein